MWGAAAWVLWVPFPLGYSLRCYILIIVGLGGMGHDLWMFSRTMLVDYIVHFNITRVPVQVEKRKGYRSHTQSQYPLLVLRISQNHRTRDNEKTQKVLM
jgi:hypothetical protein